MTEGAVAANIAAASATPAVEQLRENAIARGWIDVPRRWQKVVCMRQRVECVHE
jgi:hypothetical protein